MDSPVSCLSDSPITCCEMESRLYLYKQADQKRGSKGTYPPIGPLSKFIHQIHHFFPGENKMKRQSKDKIVTSYFFFFSFLRIEQSSLLSIERQGKENRRLTKILLLLDQTFVRRLKLHLSLSVPFLVKSF